MEFSSQNLHAYDDCDDGENACYDDDGDDDDGKGCCYDDCYSFSSNFLGSFGKFEALNN